MNGTKVGRKFIATDAAIGLNIYESQYVHDTTQLCAVVAKSPSKDQFNLIYWLGFKDILYDEESEKINDEKIALLQCQTFTLLQWHLKEMTQ